MVSLDFLLDTLLRRPGGGASDSSTPGAVANPYYNPDPSGTTDGSDGSEEFHVPPELAYHDDNDPEDTEIDYDLFIPMGNVGMILDFLDGDDDSLRSGFGINYTKYYPQKEIIEPIFESLGIAEEDFAKAFKIHEPITDLRLDAIWIPVPTLVHIYYLGQRIDHIIFAPIPGTEGLTIDGKPALWVQLIVAVALYGLILWRFPQVIGLMLRSGLIGAGVGVTSNLTARKYRAAVLSGLGNNALGIDEILDDLATLATSLFENGVTDSLSDQDSELIRKLKLWTRTL
uniref:Uncharacterized protein n=1 Tax=viral metagenome TaxID=1070528 RepID=A0A2V0R913_9ZZZZ